MLWLGGLADRILHVHPSDSETDPLLFTLVKGAQECFKKKWYGKVLNFLSTFPGYALFFSAVTVFFWIITLWFGSELVSIWLCFVNYLKTGQMSL